MTDKDDLDRLIRAAWCCAAANIDDLRTAAAAELLDLLAVYRTVQSWTTDSPVIDLLDDDIDSDTNNHH